MKKTLLISAIMVLCGSSPAFSQQTAPFGNLNIQQKFDQVYAQFYLPKWDNDWNPYDMYYNNSAYTTCDPNNVGAHRVTWYQQNLLGSTLSGSLDALLVMYEATCDKKYLVEFMKRATQLVNNRADKISPQFSSMAYWFKDQVQWHGRILTPLAHFVVLVDERNLENDLLPAGYNFGGNTTYGGFANWVNTNNIEVMDALMARFWRGQGECMCKPLTVQTCNTVTNNAISLPCNTTSGSIAELNFQAAWGTAFIYMYVANPSRTDYGTKAVQMAQAYLIKDGGIFTYVASKKAYVWDHHGWQASNQYSEDIGHAAFDIAFPILYNKYYNKITGVVTAGQYFYDTQLTRIKNTFSKFIYNENAASIPATYLNGTTFNATVGGNNTGYYGVVPQAQIQSRAKNWIGLHKFDNNPESMGEDVYDILMSFYINVESGYGSTDNNYGGIMIKSLADMCLANYEREGIHPIACIPIAFPDKRNASADFEPLTNELLVAPNPATNVISLAHYMIDLESTPFHVTLINTLGEFALEADNQTTIDVTNLPKGIYVVRLSTSTGDFHTKLVLE